jgi:hypothetical protein
MADQRVRSNDDTDEIIRHAVIKNLQGSSSPPQWQDIANRLKDIGIIRTGRQVRESWVNYLNPFLNFEPFTPEEMEILKKLYSEALAQDARGQTRMLKSGKLQLPLKENGETMSWELILPGRSPNVVKNKYYSHQKYWNRPDIQPDQHQLYSVNTSISEERDDDKVNNSDFYDSSLHEDGRGDRPFAFSLTTEYDTPLGAAFGPPFDERRGGKSARKSARKPSRKPSRKSSRKAKKSSRKYRKVSRK